MNNKWDLDPELQELMEMEEAERRQATYQPPAPQPAMPYGAPQGYQDPLAQNALAELQRWLSLYEGYRGQGSFAQFEPVFQAIHRLSGR